MGRQDERVRSNDIGPCGGQRYQSLCFVLEEDSFLTPSLLVRDEFKLASVPGMVRMSDAKSSCSGVTLRCSRRPTPKAEWREITAPTRIVW